MPDIANPKRETVDEQLADKLAKKERISPAAAVQKLALMRQHAQELRELMEAAPDGNLNPVTTLENLDATALLSAEPDPSATGSAKPTQPGNSETEGTGGNLPRRGRHGR